MRLYFKFPTRSEARVFADLAVHSKTPDVRVSIHRRIEFEHYVYDVVFDTPE